MKLPEWANRALDQFKPEVSYSKDEPNPEMLEKWRSIKKRFENRWSEVGPDDWKIPEQHPQYAAIEVHCKYPPIEHFKQAILEIAIESAWDISTDKSPTKTLEAQRNLYQVNNQIIEAAENLASLFRQRQTLQADFHLTDKSLFYEQNRPDPFDVFGAFELALKGHEYCAWAMVDRPVIDAFLAIAKKSSAARPRPDWSALLDQLSYRETQTITGRDAGDIAVLSGTTNKSDWSPLCRRLIARFEERHESGFSDGFLLTWLTNLQLASLASVAFDAGPDAAINEDQIRKLKSTSKKRREKQDDLTK
jgi:hypothetical protein